MVKCDKSNPKVNCIGLILDQNLTDAFVEDMKAEDGYVKTRYRKRSSSNCQCRKTWTE